MVEQWGKAQAIGLAAFYASAEKENPLGVTARRRLPALLSDWGWRDERKMRTLPSSVLHVLASLQDEDLQKDFKTELQTRAQETLAFLAPAKNAPLAKAEILAHQIMYDTGPSRRIIRLAMSLMDRERWQILQEGDRHQRFDDAVSCLRAPNGDIAERLRAIGHLGDLLMLACPSITPHVGNVLFQHTFCWPLLVFSGVAVSVPVAVDVDLTWPAPTQRLPVHLTGAEAFDLRCSLRSQAGTTEESWLHHLGYARKAACVLWTKTHGNCGQFRLNVRDHQTRVDLLWATNIVRGAFGPTAPRIPLIGDSATAYFSQVILARLLGRRWYLSSAATGAVGPRVVLRRKADNPELSEDEVDRDFEFTYVEGVLPKLHYIQTTRSFERFVLPKGSESAVAKAKKNSAMQVGEEVQTLFPTKLSGVADIMQVEGWRKTHFIRCPEVAEVEQGHAKHQIAEAYREEARAVQQKIATHHGSVLRLEPGWHPVAVALAVAEMNRLLHRQAQQGFAADTRTTQPKALRPSPKQRKPGHFAPGLSWCVIRAVKEEQDASFWRTLWQTTGAPLNPSAWCTPNSHWTATPLGVDTFASFRHSATREVAASRLSRVLNCYTPTEVARSHRAPDIIIVIGAEKFAESTLANKTPLARPLAVEALLNEMDDRRLLRPSHYRRKVPYLRELAGTVRFVLVPECEEDPVPQCDVLLDDTAHERNIMWALATFRFGFTQHMASLLLSEYGIYGIHVRDTLKKLVSKGALRELPGQYFISQAMKQDLHPDDAVDLRRRARLQSAAGLALAPYVTTTPVPGLAYDVAYLPENVKEAEFHLQNAYQDYNTLTRRHTSSRNSDAIQEQHRVGIWLKQVRRFSSAPTWAEVRWLNKVRFQGPDAWDLANELMEGWRLSGGAGDLPPHPNHFKEALTAATHWEGVKADEVARMYEAGLAACCEYPSEAEFCEVQLGATYAMYLYRRHPHQKAGIEEADRRVIKHKDRWTHVPGEWFEKNGDTCQEHKGAAEHYILGTHYAPEYAQTWVKAFGAGSLARMDLSEVLRTLIRLGDEELPALLAFAERPKTLQRQQKAGALSEQRWRQGILVLRDAVRQACRPR